MTKGPVQPVYAYGKCGFDPSVAGAPGGLCGAAATVHLLIRDDELWRAFACTDHVDHARAVLDPIDWHDVEASCLIRGAHWQVGMHPPGDGFCFDPNEDLVADAAVTSTAPGVALEAVSP